MAGSSLYSPRQQQSFVSPIKPPTRAKRRHAAVHTRDALRIMSETSTPGTEELPTSLCTQGVSAKDYWVPKSKPGDPFLQKLLAAKNLNLERLPFRDSYLYQYGVLPDQYKPPMDDHAISIHPCDKVDAKLPQSLVRMESKKHLGNGHRKVSAWDGTMKNVTAPLLWRVREPLF